ncbi:MAG: hypothetical protein JNM62_11980 [Flavobacteriales bacterium]|nr:hypothetical protein [Flavobacteriales bacterium]
MRNRSLRLGISPLLIACLSASMAQTTVSHAPGHLPTPTSKSDDRVTLNQYCTPSYVVGPADGDLIDGVQFGDINRNNTGANNGSGYSDASYEGQGYTTELTAGETYSLTVQSGPYQPPSGSFEHYKVWIDFDRDLEFEVNEEVFNAQMNVPYFAVSAAVTIPNDATAGYTGMRVRNVYNDGSFTPCSSHNYGETEDYTVLIHNGLPCIPYSLYGGHLGDFISGITLGDLSYQTTAPPVHAYTSRMDLGTHLVRGSSNTLQVVSGDYPQDHYGAWIDWNHDGDRDDPDEEIGLVEIAQPLTPHDFTFTVPDHAKVGYTVLRVRCMYDSPFGDACSFATHGDAQDFTVGVSAESYPCLPVSGAGTVFGDGFSTCTVPGTAVFLGTEEWPFYQLSSEPIHFAQGETTVLNLITGAYAPERFVASMDMNDDGDFDDAGEELASGQSAVAFASLQLFYTIPLDCPPGQHVLRLRAFDPNNGPAYPCDMAYYGEVLDIPIAVNVPNGPCMPYTGNVGLWGTINTFIDGVQLGDISNTGSGGAYTAPYKDYTAMSTLLTTNNTYALTVTSGASQFDVFTAWIDYNDDGDWDDAGEMIDHISTIPGSFTDSVMTFTVPSVPLGEKVMRIRARGGGAPSPCSDAQFGETEDYTVFIETNTGIASHASSTWSARPLYDASVIELTASNHASDARYLLLDAVGRELAAGRVVGTSTLINGGALATGTYTVVVQHGDHREALRFVWVR